jgi:serine/threonine protein kinase
MVNSPDVTRYELLDRIGVGGMAEIFRGKAVAAGGFEKPVAIKRILPHLSQDRRFVELLIAEAKVLSLLKHRNIVQIFDVGLGDDGQYFLVMEFVDGKDVGSVQRALEQQRRRMPFDLVLHIGAEICEALEHAVMSRGPDGKAMSLVHRDVSPSNVLLSRAGEVKLTDFGIAKRAEQDATRGGAVRGKFAYISPEQARNEHLDPRSDVFSVGILLWELLCGRRLFSQLGDLEALRAVRDPRVQRPTEIDRSFPPVIDEIIMTALSRDKQRRYPSAGAFGAKLRSLRYTLDSTVGDPATELAKLIDSTEAVERESRPPATIHRGFPGHDFDVSEATVIRIQTADAFSARDNESSIVAAREVIDRFEDEETRLAQFSGDQLRQLREAAPRDSSEAPVATVPRKYPRAPSDEATRAIVPVDFDKLHARDRGFEDNPESTTNGGFDDPPTTLPMTPVDGNTPPHQHFSPNEDTRLFQARDRRTPPPQPISRDPISESQSASYSASQSRTNRPPTAPPTVLHRGKPPTNSRPREPTPSAGQRGAPVAPVAPAPQVAPAPVPLASTLPGAPAPTPQAPPTFGYPGWGPPVAAGVPAPTPIAPTVDRPVYPPRPAVLPRAQGFHKPPPPTYAFKPWMLVVGAILVAILAFVITRAFIS